MFQKKLGLNDLRICPLCLCVGVLTEQCIWNAGNWVCFWARLLKGKTHGPDSVCTKGTCPSVGFCARHEVCGCAGKNKQRLVGLGWHQLMRWDIFSVIVEALHVFFRCSIDFGCSEVSRGKDEWIGSISPLAFFFIVLHLQTDLLLMHMTALSVTWSEFAGSVPDEADGKEGCTSQMVFLVCHQLWCMAVWDAGEKHALNFVTSNGLGA